MSTPHSGQAEPLALARRLLADHPALALTLFYLVASALGMLFSAFYFDRFGINFFLYADAADFLMASFREPYTWAVLGLAIAAVVVDNAMSRRVSRRGGPRWLQWYSSPRYRQFNYLTLLLLTFLLLYLIAQDEAEDALAGEGMQVAVTLADGSAPIRRVLLGVTMRFLFLLESESGAVTIHPYENVAGIAPIDPAGARRSTAMREADP